MNPKIRFPVPSVEGIVLSVALSLPCLSAHAFDSGSSGADGALAPSGDVTLQLPPSGIFNFTTVTIPRGVTVRFKRNATNTPVVMLASGDVLIGGTIDVSGTSAPATGTAGDGVVADDGQPGLGGPGGYDGGYGGELNSPGGYGLGPGGGVTGWGTAYPSCGTTFFGYNAAHTSDVSGCSTMIVSKAYGSPELIPLVGGSGGGGGWGGSNFKGSGGGGGGGALLIASSGRISFDSNHGVILANGGGTTRPQGNNAGYVGGNGSGGAVRLVATSVVGSGTIQTRGGYSDYWSWGNPGRARIEAESYTCCVGLHVGYASGSLQSSTPGPVFIAGLPGLRITRIAGLPVPEAPTGRSDVTLPLATPNPVTVEFETTGVPVGNTVRLTVTPHSGESSSVVSPALTGSTAKAAASVSVDIPEGETTLLAQTTYIVLAAVGDQLAPYAGGERVEKVRLAADLQGRSRAYLITVSGREFEVDPRLLAMAAAG